MTTKRHNEVKVRGRREEAVGCACQDVLAPEWSEPGVTWTLPCYLLMGSAREGCKGGSSSRAGL